MRRPQSSLPTKHAAGPRLDWPDRRQGPLADSTKDNHEDSNHRTAWHPLPDHPGRHAMGGLRGNGVGRLQRRRAGHPHRADAADPRGAGRRNPPLPRYDRQAIRREPDAAAVHQPAAVRALPRRHHRERRQGAGDRRQQPQGTHRARQGRRPEGDPQVRGDPPCAVGRAPGRRRGVDRRLRVRRPPGRGRCPRHGADPAGGTQAVGAGDRLGRHRRRPRHGRRAGAGRRGREHGHALLRHPGSADPRQRQAGAGAGQRARHQT